MRNNRLFILLVSWLCIINLSSCGKDKTQDPKLYSSSLIVVPNAKKVKYLKLHGTDQVYYQLREQYPAVATIKEIYTQLEKAGWQPLPEDVLNPGLSSSLSRGWSVYIDQTGKYNVQQWMADWKDNQNNSVRFVFKYNWPAIKYGETQTIRFDDPKRTYLNVIGIYTPAALEKSREDWARSVEPKSEIAAVYEQATTEFHLPVNQLSMDIFAFQRDRAEWPGSVEELRIFALAHNLPIDLTRFDHISFQPERDWLTVNFSLKEYQKQFTLKNGKPELIRIAPRQVGFVFDQDLTRILSSNFQAAPEVPSEKVEVFSEILTYQRVKSKWPTTYVELQQFAVKRKEILDLDQYADVLFSEQKDGKLKATFIYTENGRKNSRKPENIGTFGIFTTEQDVPYQKIYYIDPLPK
jgi:hypothetical protein